MINKKFGKLTVIRELPERKFTSIVYECLCDCGNVVNVQGYRLRNGRTKSCGCLKSDKLVDLTGNKYGRLTVIELAHKKGGAHWLCQCDCGGTAIAKSYDLKNGISTSCGCYNMEVRKATISERFGFVDGTNLSNIKDNRKVNKNSKSGVTGVNYIVAKKKWKASLTLKRKNIHLGYYDNIEEAIQARKDGEEKYYKPILGKQ